MIVKDENNKNKKIVIIILIVLLLSLLVSRLVLTDNKEKQNPDNKTNINDKNTKENEDTKNDNKEEDTSKNENEEKNKNDIIKFTYKQEEYTLNSNNNKIKISSMRKIIQETEDNNVNKAIKFINDKVDKKWQSLKKQMDEQIQDINEDNIDYEDEYGINYVIINYSNSKIVTFVISTIGNMGGVPWDSEEGYIFDRTTGKQLSIQDICINESKCKDHILDYFLLQLKNDERFANVYEDYRDTIQEDIFTDGNWYLYEDGLKLIVPKYEISDGGTGAFTYTMPYNLLNELLNEKYK